LLDAEVERLVLLKEDGSANDILAVTFRNPTSNEILLCEGAIDLIFEYNDSATELIEVRDRGGRDRVLGAVDCIRSERSVFVPIEGGVPARGSRTVMVRVRHRDLARQVDGAGALFLDDPLYAWELSGLPVSRVRYRADVVFPASDFRRRIVADDAQNKTSRTVSWDWGATMIPGGNLQMRAHQERGAVVLAPRRLDDAIAEVYRLIFKSHVGVWPDTERLRELLRYPSIVSRIGQAEVLPDETQLVDMGHDERVGLFRALLVRLHTMRKEIIDKPGAEVVVAEDTEERAERIARKAERLRQEKGITAPFPRDADAALIEVLHYQARLRQDPSPWPERLKESDFHKHVAGCLGNRKPPPGSEVPLAGGFLDLKLGDTPIELKVANLHGDPARRTARFRPQIAAYAAGCGKGLAILLVLDRYIYPEGDLGPPGLDEQWRVDVEKTHVGVSGEPTHVIVVTIVVLARLTAPSSLRSPKKSKPRRKNGNPEKNQAVSSLVAGIARGSQ
jgi:hypothetical protein